VTDDNIRLPITIGAGAVAAAGTAPTSGARPLKLHPTLHVHGHHLLVSADEVQVFPVPALSEKPWLTVSGGATCISFVSMLAFTSK
jgi:hypothetical protein